MRYINMTVLVILLLGGLSVGQADEGEPRLVFSDAQRLAARDSFTDATDRERIRRFLAMNTSLRHDPVVLSASIVSYQQSLESMHIDFSRPLEHTVVGGWFPLLGDLLSDNPLMRAEAFKRLPQKSINGENGFVDLAYRRAMGMARLGIDAAGWDPSDEDAVWDMPVYYKANEVAVLTGMGNYSPFAFSAADWRLPMIEARLRMQDVFTLKAWASDPTLSDGGRYFGYNLGLLCLLQHMQVPVSNAVLADARALLEKPPISDRDIARISAAVTGKKDIQNVYGSDMIKPYRVATLAYTAACVAQLGEDPAHPCVQNSLLMLLVGPQLIMTKLKKPNATYISAELGADHTRALLAVLRLKPYRQALAKLGEAEVVDFMSLPEWHPWPQPWSDPHIALPVALAYNCAHLGDDLKPLGRALHAAWGRREIYERAQNGHLLDDTYQQVRLGHCLARLASMYGPYDAFVGAQTTADKAWFVRHLPLLRSASPNGIVMGATQRQQESGDPKADQAPRPIPELTAALAVHEARLFRLGLARSAVDLEAIFYSDLGPIDAAYADFNRYYPLVVFGLIAEPDSDDVHRLDYSLRRRLEKVKAPTLSGPYIALAERILRQLDARRQHDAVQRLRRPYFKGNAVSVEVRLASLLPDPVAMPAATASQLAWQRYLGYVLRSGTHDPEKAREHIREAARRLGDRVAPLQWVFFEAMVTGTADTQRIREDIAADPQRLLAYTQLLVLLDDATLASLLEPIMQAGLVILDNAAAEARPKITGRNAPTHWSNRNRQKVLNLIYKAQKARRLVASGYGNAFPIPAYEGDPSDDATCFRLLQAKDARFADCLDKRSGFDGGPPRRGATFRQYGPFEFALTPIVDPGLYARLFGEYANLVAFRFVHQLALAMGNLAFRMQTEGLDPGWVGAEGARLCDRLKTLDVSDVIDDPGDYIAFTCSFTYAAAGNAAKARTELETTDDTYAIALTRYLLGEKDAAMRILSDAAQTEAGAQCDPILFDRFGAPWRDDPRFAPLLAACESWYAEQMTVFDAFEMKVQP